MGADYTYDHLGQEDEDLEPRCPVLLLIDASEDMGGEIHQNLQAGLWKLAEYLRADLLAAERVEIGVYTFSGAGLEFLPFEQAASFRPPDYDIRAGAPLGAALEASLVTIQTRVRELEEKERTCYQPWIFLLSAGRPTDEWQDATRNIQAAEQASTFFFFSIGVADADMATLEALSTRRARKLAGLDFSGLFRWIADALIAVSHSDYGDTVRLPPDRWSERPTPNLPPEPSAPPALPLPPVYVDPDWTPDPQPPRRWRLPPAILVLLLALPVASAGVWWAVRSLSGPSPRLDSPSPAIPDPLLIEPGESVADEVLPDPAPEIKPAKPPRRPNVHIVQPNESLSAIAALYPPLTVADLRAANGLAADTIYPGDELKLVVGAGLREAAAETGVIEPVARSESRLGPLAVLLDNTDMGYPQTGLIDASAVYEMPVEGGLTRLMAVYDKPVVSQVGPVRSARDYFLEVADGLGGVLVHAGGSPSALARIAQTDLPTLDALDKAKAHLFKREKNRAAPYNLFAEGEGLRVAADQQKPSAALTISASSYNPGDAFAEVGAVTVSFSSAYTSGFRYVPSDGLYRWERGGQAAADASGVAFVTDAVIVARVPVVPFSDDPEGRLNITLQGGEAVLYFRGEAVPCSWSLIDGFHLTGEDGSIIDLSLLRTWVLFAPSEAKVVEVPPQTG